MRLNYKKFDKNSNGIECIHWHLSHYEITLIPIREFI